MSEKEKTEEKRIEEIVAEMLRKASPGGEPGGQDPVTMMKQIAVGLEQGMMEIYNNLTVLGQGVDISRLQSFMITQILIDKGIVTEEEVESRYKKDVADKLKEAYEEMRKNAEKDLQNTVEDKEEKDNN